MNETDPNWIAAAIAVGAGIAVGSILARIARSVLSRERHPDGIRNAAGAIASLFFALALIVGLITALMSLTSQLPPGSLGERDRPGRVLGHRHGIG